MVIILGLWLIVPAIIIYNYGWEPLAILWALAFIVTGLIKLFEVLF